ncbi:DNA helicase [Tanacetum coccineum]
MPTEIELALEQTQQGASYEVSSDTKVFTMTMEILPEPTSNKLYVQLGINGSMVMMLVILAPCASPPIINEDQQTYQLLDALHCKKVRTIDGHTKFVGTLAWSSSMIYLGSRDTSILQRNPHAHQSFVSGNDKKLATVTGHTDRVVHLPISPDGQTIVTGAGNGMLRFWNVFPPCKPQGSLAHLVVISRCCVLFCGYFFILKTRRKLVHKSYPITGDGNVVSLDVGHRVYDVNSNVSPKRQCLGRSSFISSPAIDVSPFGVRNMTTISGTVVPSTDIVVKVFVSSVECQTPSHSVIPTSISRESMDITEPNADVAHIGQPESYSSRRSGAGISFVSASRNHPLVAHMSAQLEYVVSNSNNRSRGRRSRTRRNPPVTGGSSSQQPPSSGPPLEYKYLGGWSREHPLSMP